MNDPRHVDEQHEAAVRDRFGQVAHDPAKHLLTWLARHGSHGGRMIAALGWPRCGLSPAVCTPRSSEAGTPARTRGRARR
jgi:hypothetical protein